MKKFWIVLVALIVMNASSPVFAEGFFNFGKKDKKVKEVKQEVKKEMKKIEAKSEEAENKDEKAEPLKYEKSSLVEVKEYEEGEETGYEVVTDPNAEIRQINETLRIANAAGAASAKANIPNNPNAEIQKINETLKVIRSSSGVPVVPRAPQNPNQSVPKAPEKTASADIPQRT